jgi:hypothetical protein
MFKDATAFEGVDFAFRSLLDGCGSSRPVTQLSAATAGSVI